MRPGGCSGGGSRSSNRAGLGESTVRRIVAELLRELRDGVSLVAVPQTHPPAEEAVVDSAGSNTLG